MDECLGNWRNGYEDIMNWQRCVQVNAELVASIYGLLSEWVDGWMVGWVGHGGSEFSGQMVSWMRVLMDE